MASGSELKTRNRQEENPHKYFLGKKIKPARLFHTFFIQAAGLLAKKPCLVSSVNAGQANFL